MKRERRPGSPKRAALAVLVVTLAGCVPNHAGPARSALAEEMVLEAFATSPDRLRARTQQDRSQALCSRSFGAELSRAEREEVSSAANSSVAYPRSGVLLGDWKRGESIALDGAGQRVRSGRIESAMRNGGNCYACHAIDPNNVNGGNLGPELSRYRTIRGGTASIIKYTYEKIYNAWAFSACSTMPRFGANGYLTPEEIADVVAYLIDPASPVNKK